VLTASAAVEEVDLEGCIKHIRDKVSRKRVGTRDEGSRGAIIAATGLWDDEGREALWWQRPHKLGESICICEERARTILHGRKGGRLAAS